MKRTTYGKSPKLTSTKKRPVARTRVLPVAAASSKRAIESAAVISASRSSAAAKLVAPVKSKFGSSGAYCSKRTV